MTTAEDVDFNAYQPNGEPAADRWLTALHLFGDPDGSTEPPTAENWERARLLFEVKDYRAAIRLLLAVVEEVPEQVAPRLLLARGYYHSAQLRHAEEQLRAVIERDPVEHYAHLMLGRTLERQGRHTEAAPWLRTAVAMGASVG
jgi:predicted Zn-dependent protease